MASLVLIDKDIVSHRYPLEKTETMIGRRADNDILISNMMVSGNHAKIVKKGSQFFVQDLGSTNGTSVNGSRVNGSIEIFHNDHVNLGGMDFVFLVDDSATVQVGKEKKKPSPTDFSIIRIRPDDTGYADRFNSTQLVEMINLLKTLVSTPKTDPNKILAQCVEIEHAFVILKDQLKESEKFQQKLNTLYEIGKIINLIFDEDELLSTIIDLALKVMNADCGFIMLYDDAKELVPKISRKIESDEFSQSTHTFSKTIAKKVAETCQSVLTSDAQNDDRFQDGASIISHHIRSVICSPLKNKDQKVIGVLYVGSNVMSNVFSKADVELLEAFSNHAAIAIENAKLYEERRRKEHLKSALERYVSKQIAEMIISNDDNGNFRFVPERREVTLIFADVRGFTTLSENMSPEDMVEILNRYFTRMINIIFKHGGTLDKFMGDSIMALFGAPASTGDDAYNAIMAAVDMLKDLVQFNQEQEKLGKPPLRVGIGINTGHVVVGNIGSDQRMEYSAIGDNVNLASRLQGSAAGGQILISKATYDKVSDRIKGKKLDPIMVKGKSKPIEIYEVIY